MNLETMIEVIRAKSEGRTVQSRLCAQDTSDETNPWIDVHPNSGLTFFNGYEYRVKPEPPKPREFWIQKSELTPFVHRALSIKPLDDSNLIKVREVL